MKSNSKIEPPVYLRAAEVQRMFGSVSTMWLRRQEANGFPKPVKFGSDRSQRFWKRADVLAWAAMHERAAS